MHRFDEAVGKFKQNIGFDPKIILLADKLLDKSNPSLYNISIKFHKTNLHGKLNENNWITKCFEICQNNFIFQILVNILKEISRNSTFYLIFLNFDKNS
jgi:hypothetical protein